MKKGLTVGIALITTLSLAACGNSQAKSDKAKKDSSSLVTKKKAKAKKESIKKAKAASESKAKSLSESKANSQSTAQTQQGSSTTQQTQTTQNSNNNRGFNSGVQTSSDPWIADQEQWELENGYVDANGNQTAKGRAADSEVMANADPNDTGDPNGN